MLTGRQWGFRPNRSTIDASSELIETILLGLNEKGGGDIY